MRRQLVTLGAAFVLAGASGFATAQPLTPGPGMAAMPGQVVSNTVTLSSAGTQVPRAVPQAGNPIGSPFTQPYDPSKPQDALKQAAALSGTSYDSSAVVAPVSGFPGIANQQPDLLTRLYNKLTSVTDFLHPSDNSAPPTVTPGIFRRNRERYQNRMWRRD